MLSLVLRNPNLQGAHERVKLRVSQYKLSSLDKTVGPAEGYLSRSSTQGNKAVSPILVT